MLIIADKRIPKEAKDRLSEIGDLCLFSTENIVYEAISGHPDIFIFQKGNSVILAPETPKYIIDKLQQYKIDITFGSSNVGEKHPQTTPYNIAYGDGVFVGNSKTTDNAIMNLSSKETWFQSPQSYARCNTIVLDKSHIITSEHTVASSIEDSLFINPKEVILAGYPHGFFGGCVGFYKNKLYLLGRLKYHSQHKEILQYCNKLNIEIVELYDGVFFDGGGVFFFD
ncbi:MAG: hypothetical protein DRI86_04930 [Bacteroidetes bacterium]|nr:MAG: hypothetical protein DRI86_04930 [Bacteroidota bacterium]